jgi:DNA-binding PucR family transcriptional regulator
MFDLIQIELERLNHANEAINHLELQLDVIQSFFSLPSSLYLLFQEARKNLKDFSDAAEEELSQLEKNIGSAVSKARSYYDARIKLRDVREALTKAKHRFERAQALHVAAKELAVVSVRNLWVFISYLTLI